MTKTNPFKWHHFESEIILLYVRWHLGYSLSYRDLKEMMQEGGLSVDQWHKSSHGSKRWLSIRPSCSCISALALGSRLGDQSRRTREGNVRFYESLEVKLPPPGLLIQKSIHLFKINGYCNTTMANIGGACCLIKIT